MILLYLLVYALGLLTGMFASGYLWGKANEALADLILTRAGICGDAHNYLTRCQLPIGHKGPHQNVSQTHRQEWG